MKNESLLSPSLFFLKYLQAINDIKFTRREIDIISFIVGGRSTKKIAQLSGLSPRTVENYTRNIRVKLECNSRESIIDFVEKSGKISFIRKHYSSLVIHVSFVQMLRDIGKKTPEKEHVTMFYAREEDKILCTQLECDLRLIGFTVNAIREEDIFFRQCAHEQTKNSHIICVLPRRKIKKMGGELPHYFFLLIEDNSKENHSFEDAQDNILDVGKQESYYDSFFKVLRKILPYCDYQEYIEHFKKIHYSTSSELSNNTPSSEIGTLFQSSKARSFKGIKEKLLQIKEKYPIIFNKYAICLAIIIATMINLAAGYITIRDKQEINDKNDKNNKKLANIPLNTSEVIRSDLNVPIESALLERPQITKQIDDAFKQYRGIYTVALVGIGGSGKTTISRQYARHQKVNVIWEINAETIDSLILSLENLAYTLAKTEEDKSILKEIQSIRNSDKQERKFLDFVKARLKKHLNWLLIYDNVESMEALKQFLPNDPTIWGEGKIIITTRDENVINSSYVNKVIKVPLLNLNEKSTLFCKILEHSPLHDCNSKKQNQIKEFLNKIPPFPLDITTAAYYLMATDTSYEEYLEKLNKSDRDFLALQENILKKYNVYDKTRYGIMTITINNILNSHKEFKELMLLVSLLNSQNIPRDLLKSLKGSVVTDNFISTLKKYSFISTNMRPAVNLTSAISIHPSIQEACLIYLRKTLKPDKDSKLIKLIALMLENDIAQALKKDNLSKIQLLEAHAAKFFSHRDLLNDTVKGQICVAIGNTKFYLGSYKKAKYFLEEGIKYFSSQTRSDKNQAKLARALTDLGEAYRSLGHYNKAINFLEKSRSIYEENLIKDFEGLYRTLLYLGIIHRELDNYTKAKDLLRRAFSLYRKQSGQTDSDLILILTHMANNYYSLGEYEKAKRILEKNLILYKSKPYNQENIKETAFNITVLGKVYRKLGNYKHARVLFEESLALLKKHFGETYVDFAWASTCLAKTYIDQGEYEKAKGLLEKSLKIYQRRFSMQHVCVGWVLAHLGNIYNSLGEYEKAKNLLEDSLVIYERTFSENHLSSAWVSVHLASVYSNLGDYDKAKSLLKTSLLKYKKIFNLDCLKIAGINVQLGNTYLDSGDPDTAKCLLKKSLERYEQHYGGNHIETARVLRSLGRAYLGKGQTDAALLLLMRSLESFEKNNHIEKYTSLEILSDIYLKKSIEAHNKGDAQLEKKFKYQALIYLRSSLKSAMPSFLSHSSHISRIQSKIQCLSEMGL